MTKRLQVLMDDDELLSIQRLARLERMTTAEWVRQRLREAQEVRARPDIAAKLAAIQRASKFSAPAPDIEQMLGEIGRGYLEDRGDHEPRVRFAVGGTCPPSGEPPSG